MIGPDRVGVEDRSTERDTSVPSARLNDGDDDDDGHSDASATWYL